VLAFPLLFAPELVGVPNVFALCSGFVALLCFSLVAVGVGAYMLFALKILNFGKIGCGDGGCKRL